MRNTDQHGTRVLVDEFMSWTRGLARMGVRNAIYQPEWLAAEPYLARLRWGIGQDDITLLLSTSVNASAPMGSADEHTVPLVLARYLSPTRRRRLTEAGWSYWDATGNARIACADPSVLIVTDGAQRAPSQIVDQPNELRSLGGEATAAVIVRLLTNRSVATMRDLARESGAGLGTVSRVVSTLRRENMLEPTGSGPIIVSDRVELLRRWSEDYQFGRRPQGHRYRSPLGPDGALAALARLPLDTSWALTGLRAAAPDFAARTLTMPAPVTDLWLYAADPRTIESQLKLVPDRAGDIVLARGAFLDAAEGYNRSTPPRVWPWRVAGDLVSHAGRHASVGLDLAGLLEVPRG